MSPLHRAKLFVQYYRSYGSEYSIALKLRRAWWYATLSDRGWEALNLMRNEYRQELSTQVPE